MDLYREFQCGACDYYFSHPIDRCPICGDQFFWLVTTQGNLAPSERQEYVSSMVRLGGMGVTEEFLTHRDRLWLPYNFWEVDPGGETLEAMAFVRDIKLYQHKKKAGDHADTTTRALSFETNPSMPVLTERDIQQPVAKSYEQSFAEPIQQPISQASGHQTSVAQATVQVPQQALAQSGNPKPVGSEELQPITSREWLPPVLIFIFLILMSLSFLVLRYQKNVRVNKISTHIEANYEHSILS